MDAILDIDMVNYVLGSKERLMYLLVHSADAPLTINNRLTVLKDASEKYPGFKMIDERNIIFILVLHYRGLGGQ